MMSDELASTPESPSVWHRWLEIVLVLLLAYSLLLVFAGAVAGSLFSGLGFGPPDSVDTSEFREYVKLPYMVLGAVLAGWSFMMLHISRGPLRQAAPWAHQTLVRSVVLWFTLDTGMSLVLGHPTHALFNLSFAIALGIPLAKLSPTTR